MPQMKSRATNKSEMQNAAAPNANSIHCGETANGNVLAIAVMNESTSGYKIGRAHV